MRCYSTVQRKKAAFIHQEWFNLFVLYIRLNVASMYLYLFDNE